MIYINAEEFLDNSAKQQIIDVRSPSEFYQGHIPGSFNLPLFDDIERKKIGILYKNSGREASLLHGLEIAGPKMTGFIRDLKNHSPSKDILVHCWRGGMRSKGMAWLFDMAGFRVKVLQGGYKSYRTYIRQQLNKSFQLIILGGYTGSGKSEILELISKKGEQVLDIEGLACHKGSAFGDLGQPNQPTNEQFENNLYHELHKLDMNSVIWVEDESRGIGRVGIPEPFWLRMKMSPLLFLEVGKQIRVERLVKEYSGFDEERIASAIKRITQRLGGLDTKLAIEALERKDYKQTVSLLLNYYDKAYLAGVSNRNPSMIYRLSLTESPENNAIKVMEYYNSEIKIKTDRPRKLFLFTRNFNEDQSSIH